MDDEQKQASPQGPEVVDVVALQPQLHEDVSELLVRWTARGLDLEHAILILAGAANGAVRQLGYSLREFLELIAERWIAAGGRP
jgi:hypothetical protein